MRLEREGKVEEKGREKERNIRERRGKQFIKLFSMVVLVINFGQ